jgi:hypothetical protein
METIENKPVFIPYRRICSMEEYRAGHYNLYFAIRSAITGLMGTLMFFILAFALGSMSYIQAIALNIASFASSVILSKVFHGSIQSLVRRIFAYMEKHKRTEKVVLKFFE